ncbi:MAG: glutamine synthetase [Chitinivibrionia bacterium]|nr:glutamine synthetase [Chitinivibrionia bacterium]
MEKQYPLMNPVSVILDKPKEDYTREDLLKIIEEKNIERIIFHYLALDGKLKELRLPITCRRQAERILAEGERVDGSSLFKGLVDAGLSDVYAVPVYASAFLNPFADGSLDFMCRYLSNDGERVRFAWDTILHAASALFRERTGFELYALGELEFFLMSDRHSILYPGSPQSGYHAAAPFVKSGAILDEMVRHISQITGAVKYAHSEVGYIESVESEIEEIDGKRAEQMEIEFNPTPIEDAGDALVLARWLIRTIAHNHGCVATFAPKIEEGVAGNGMHVHMELRRDGSNRMLEADGALTSEARQLVGGLCTYADSLTAFGNTVAAAYLRMVPNQEAPTRICWSDLNRSAMIRVPLGWSKAVNLALRINPGQRAGFDDVEGRQTVELRTPDGSACIDLLLAGIALAATWGLTHKESTDIADALYVTGNIFKDKKLMSQLTPLPRNCVESSRILLEKRGLYETADVFPQSIINYIARMLQAENDEDLNARLKELPADERTREMRRTMHKNLHRH